MDQNRLVQTINTQLQTTLPENISEEDLVKRMADFIDHLITNDFQKLIRVLYKADVSEVKLKDMLQTNLTKDAAEIIAKLLLEREKEKIKSRTSYGTGKISNEEEM